MSERIRAQEEHTRSPHRDACRDQVDEMSSSVLPAALRRRRMGLADGLDIGSLLSYELLITRKELRSSVG